MKNSSDKIHLLQAKLSELDSKKQSKQRLQIAKLKEEIYTILIQNQTNSSLWNLFLTCFPKEIHFNYGLKILQLSAQNSNNLKILNETFQKSWNEQIYINVGLTKQESKILNIHILELCMRDQLQFKNYVLKAVPHSRQICDKFISSLYHYFLDKTTIQAQKKHKNNVCLQTILEFLIKVCKQSDKFSDDALRYALQTILIIYKDNQTLTPIIPKLWKQVFKKILKEQRCGGIIYQIIGKYLIDFVNSENSEAQIVQVSGVVQECSNCLKSKFTLPLKDDLKNQRFALKHLQSDKYELSEKFLIGATIFIEAAQNFYEQHQRNKFESFKQFVNYLITYQNHQTFAYTLSTISLYKSINNKSVFQLLSMNDQQLLQLLVTNMPNFNDKKIPQTSKQIIKQILQYYFQNDKAILIKRRILKAMQIVQDYQFDEYQFCGVCQTTINIRQWLTREDKEFLLDFLKVLLNYNDSFQGKIQDKIILARNLTVTKVLEIISYYPFLFSDGEFLKKVYGEKLAERFPKSREFIDKAMKSKILDQYFCRKLKETINNGYQDPVNNFQKKELSPSQKIQAWIKIITVQQYLNRQMIQQQHNLSIQRVDNDVFLEMLYQDIAGFKIKKGNWNRIIDKKYLIQFQRLMGQYEMEYEMQLNEIAQLLKYQ